MLCNGKELHNVNIKFFFHMFIPIDHRYKILFTTSLTFGVGSSTGDTFLNVASFLASHKRLLDSWSDMIKLLPALSKQLCKMGTCQRFSKDFGSFVGLCFQDFKKRLIPRQAQKHGFLKDATTEKEMINSLIKEGRVGRSE